MNGTRILIIEDENTVSHFLAAYFKNKKYDSVIADTGERALQLAIEFRPEIIILDLGLPDISGPVVLERLRSWSQVPIIILTANDSDDEKIKALDSGADDYLTKPFNISELEARIRAVSRRTNKFHENIIEYGNIELDLTNHSVTISKKSIHLTSTEFDILKNLILNNGKVVTHRSMLKNIWGPNSVEHTQYLRVYVGQLRKKLTDAGLPSDIITTETGIGYRLKSI